MASKPELIPALLWKDYLEQVPSSNTLQHRLIHNPKITLAWRELDKRLNTEQIAEFYIFFKDIHAQLALLRSQSEYEADMNELAQKTHECSLILQRVEKYYGKYIDPLPLLKISDFGKHLPFLMMSNPEVAKEVARQGIKPKNIPISEYLDLISEYAKTISQTNYITAGIYSNKGNKERIFIIRKVATVFSVQFESLLKGTTARFSEAILNEEVSPDQVKDAFRNFEHT